MTRLSLIYRALAKFRHQEHANPYFAPVAKAHQNRQRILTVVAGVASLTLLAGFGLTLLNARRLTTIEISGAQYLNSTDIQAAVEKALENRNFLGLQYWYAKHIPADLIAHSLREQPLALQAVERVGSVLKVTINEQVIKGAIKQPDGWHVLGAQAETIAIITEPPNDVPVFEGPVGPEVIKLVSDYNNILRRNNQESIKSLKCDEESTGAWCSTTLRNKTISFNVTTSADSLTKLLEPLWDRPEANLDVRFEGRVYLR